MQKHVDSQPFEAVDASGNRYVIVAERDVILAFGGVERRAPWRFRLEDGRLVKPGDDFGFYTIAEDNIRLTTTDPNEPRD